MPTPRDGIQIVKGMGLILDAYVVRNKSDGVARFAKLRYHCSEILDILKETTSSNINASTDGKGLSPASMFDFLTNMMSRVQQQQPHAKSSPSSSSTHSEPIYEDLVGFDKIMTEEGSLGKGGADSNSSIDASAYRVNRSVIEKNTANNRANMREVAVPSTPLERVWGFGMLGAKMIAGNMASKIGGGGSSGQSMSDESAEQLAEALCRMRGAALKLGQMLSVQDDGALPPALVKALDRVKQGADYMPKAQLYRQLESQLGTEWRDKFAEFDEIPIAAASIGQVHKATLPDGTVVAMKIQYPGVATSIHSDLNNLKRLVTMTNLMPPGLFIDEIIKVASTELVEECDYVAEAQHQIRYRDLVLNDPVLNKNMQVPLVYPDLSSSQILTSQFVDGVSIDKALELPQVVRNAIARSILILTIRELFEWRFIQSDPNFGNFLYDDSGEKRVVNLIDFGACREYKKDFVDKYLRTVWAAANEDKETLLKESIALKFLTGDETQEMMDAHVAAAYVLGKPFRTNETYNFGSADLMKKTGQYGQTFLKYRLTPPPTEAYSLHRKLAGAILLCVRLRADIKCRDILEETFQKYDFDASE